MSTNEELIRLLNSVGKRVFAEFFDRFADPGLGNDEIVDMLPQDYTLKSRQSRVSKARRIIREGRAREALEIIAASEKVDPAAARLAHRLLKRF